MPRSYIRGIYFATYAGNTVSRSYTSFTVLAVPPDPTFAVMVMAEDFFLWNSNKRSLDFIVEQWYYKAGGVGPNIPLDFSLSYINDPPHHATALKFEWTALPPTFVYFPLPEAPPDYWLPRWL